MKRLFAILMAILVLFSLYSCKKSAVEDNTVEPLKSPVTEDDVFCVCAQFDSDADVTALLQSQGYELPALATGAFREEAATLLHTDDSDMFIYTFDDAYLAGKAYDSILTGKCDAAYPTNFMGLSGSLVRIGRYIVDESLTLTGTGKTLKTLLGLCEIPAPKAQPQGTYPERITKGEFKLGIKAIKKAFKDEEYTVVNLETAMHGAKESYLLLESNGIIAGRLDVRDSEGIASYADVVKEIYNSKIGIRYTNNGYMLFSWFEDCLTLVISDVVTETSDTVKSED